MQPIEAEIRRWHRSQRHAFTQGRWLTAGAAWSRWRDIGALLTELDRLRAMPAKRLPSSDDTIAMPTPATAIAAVELALPKAPPIDPGDQFQDATDMILGWEACRVAAEDRVASAISTVIRNGGTVVDARTQAIAAIRALRR